jgi:20S proteasome alpha/beta subunit
MAPDVAGYEVAFRQGTSDRYSVWTTDSAGNMLTNPTGVVSGASYALQSFEPWFHQNLNNDGTIGPVARVIEQTGVTALVGLADIYALGGASGPQLKFNGALVTTGQVGAWAPIAAEATAGGYEIAWKMGADRYSVWHADGDGNMLTNPTGIVSGSSYALEALEASFHQDLNGDGTIGVVATPIESSGATTLFRAADGYTLGVSGPQLMFGGATVTAGQSGAWTPIGAEAIAGGFEVAWKNGPDQYSVWDTDAQGNMLANPTGIVSGSSYALQSLEPSFQQDLNGDGTIGALTTPIESFGSTAIAQVADRYVLSTVGGSAGALLKFGGTPVTAGQAGAWTPIGAEAIAGGYEVAWKMGADQYSV